MDNRASVVLADASEEYRMMLKKTVESTGEFQVIGSTGSGAEALRMVQQMHPQLLLMDLVLPELDGFGLLKQLQSLGSWHQRPSWCPHFACSVPLVRL